MPKEADIRIKQAIAALLKGRGFKVDIIRPRPGRSTADLMAQKGGQTFVVEIKDKFDDPAMTEREAVLLEQGHIVSRSESMGSRNNMSGVIQNGVNQLIEHCDDGDCFRVLWLNARGRDSELQVRQLRATLYGIAQLVDFGSKPQDSRECYYFHESSFFTHRAVLDGAIVATDQHGSLCINSYSPRLRTFRESALVSTFEEGVCDPENLERASRIYVADCDHERQDGKALLDYIRRKYGRERLYNLGIEQHSAEMHVRP